MGAPGRQRRHRDASGGHHGQDPRGDAQGPDGTVREDVADRDGAAPLGQFDFDPLLDARVLDRSLRGERIPVDSDFDGLVVGAVAVDAVFRSHPQPAPSVEPPTVSAGLAQILFEFHEQVLAAREAVSDDAGPDIGGNDKFHLAVRDAVAVGPTRVADLFDAHGCGQWGRDPQEGRGERSGSAQDQALEPAREAVSTSPFRH